MPNCIKHRNSALNRNKKRLLRAWIVNKIWYNSRVLKWFLFPLSIGYQAVSRLRRFYLETFCQQRFPVPVIVVGNLTVGGTGKTPIVIALAHQFKARGLRVGIVSRGYAALVRSFPHEVHPDAPAELVGDEPLLIAQKTNCPVVIAPKRVEAVQYLLDHHRSQVIISDDGLQHYAMGRSVEIAVIDGQRGLGNGLCLPAGPLRERSKRLASVDFLVVNTGAWPNAYSMELVPGSLIQLVSGKTIADSVLTEPVAAVAAIGHPERFFATLKTLGISYRAYPFSDHHLFTPSDLNLKEKIIVMTEKDAVKCKSFAHECMYYLPVHAELSDVFWDALWSHDALQGLDS